MSIRFKKKMGNRLSQDEELMLPHMWTMSEKVRAELTPALSQ